MKQALKPRIILLMMIFFVSGTYELQLIQGDLCFYGDITL